MKKVDNWVNLILGLLINFYGLFLMLMILIGTIDVILDERIKFITYIISDNTMQSILIATLLIISGNYLMNNSINKDEQ